MTVKIGLVGTCQLQRIGNGLQQMIEAGSIDAELVWNLPFFEVGPAEMSLMFRALELADVVYCQYDSRPHGWTTSRLVELYPVKIVPTLYSYVARPQLDFFTGDPMPPTNFVYVDLRFLELYLDGVPYAAAAQHYQALRLERSRVDDLISREQSKYQGRFDRGQVCFNYAPFYATSMQQSLETYMTCNHPGNVHLQWLFNEIVRDCGSTTRVSITGAQDLLDGWRVPSLHGRPTDVYVMNCVEHTLAMAAKLYYWYFGSCERSMLEERYYASVYYRQFRAPLPAIRGDVACAGEVGPPILTR